MDYPHINPHIGKEALVDHFTLTQDERYYLPQWRKEKNILGFAVLLKTFSFLGFAPRSKNDVPAEIISWLSRQLDANPAEYEGYRWKSSLWDIHLASIREFTGFRPVSGDDLQKLIEWLVHEGRNHPSRSKMFSVAIQRFRRLRLELPAEKELQRLVNSAWRHYLDRTCQKISEHLPLETREKMDQCLNLSPRQRSL